jgi:hypothetical protein
VLGQFEDQISDRLILYQLRAPSIRLFIGEWVGYHECQRTNSYGQRTRGFSKYISQTISTGLYRFGGRRGFQPRIRPAKLMQALAPEQKLMETEPLPKTALIRPTVIASRPLPNL